MGTGPLGAACRPGLILRCSCCEVYVRLERERDVRAACPLGPAPAGPGSSLSSSDQLGALSSPPHPHLVVDTPSATLTTDTSPTGISGTEGQNWKGPGDSGPLTGGKWVARALGPRELLPTRAALAPSRGPCGSQLGPTRERRLPGILQAIPHSHY